MSNQERKPYVVSADTQGLLKIWALKNNLTLPNDLYFEAMLRDLERTLNQFFSEVDVIPENFLRQGLNELISTSAYPVISLDRAYINNGQKNIIGFIDATRTVDAELNSVGLGSRVIEATLTRQLNQLATIQAGKTINLVDDVIFEGKTMFQLVQKLRNRGVTVDTVFSGITILEGQELLENNGVGIKSLLVYDQVVDEICQRDFVVGAPYSGRSVVNNNGVIEGAPYLYPFGKPVEWASIPAESATDFSLFLLSQALQLWATAEKLSDQKISTQLLARPVFNLPNNQSISKSIAEVLIGEKNEKNQ